MDRYRLHQFQANALDNGDGWRCHAGDWVIQRLDENGQWRNYDGPYAPHEKATAAARLQEILDAEPVPQLFDDME